MDALLAFVAPAVLIALGWALVRWRLLPDESEAVLTALLFRVGIPAVLFVALAGADLAVVLGGIFPGIALSELVITVAFILYAVSRRRSLAQTAMGSFAAAFSNGAILGIPIAGYILGNVAYALPLIVFQLVVQVPLTMGVMDVATATGQPGARWLRWTKPIRNPVIVATVVGLVINLTGTELPGWILEPLDLLSSTMVPLGLLVFGMSLTGMTLSRRMLAADTLVATLCKSLLQPLAALVIGLALGLPAEKLFALLVIAALPTGQNVYIYARVYGVGIDIARDTIVLTTLLSMPILLLIAQVFATA